MTNPVVKIVENGKSINSSDIRDFVFHSSYPCFKLDSVKDASITINSGSTSGNTTISHNLGYVPAFLVYGEGFELFPKDIDCYATENNIVITKNLSTPIGQTKYYASDVYNYNGEVDGGSVTQWWYAGYVSGYRDRAAIRWKDIIIPQGQAITDAYLQVKNVFTDAGTDIKFYIYGIKESNTADFGSDPTGRPKTTAYENKTQSQQTSNFNFGTTIKNEMQEVVNLPGWTSGNAFGVIFQDYGSDDGHHLRQYVGNRVSSNLELTLTWGSSSTFNYKVVIFKDKIA